MDAFRTNSPPSLGDVFTWPRLFVAANLALAFNVILLGFPIVGAYTDYAPLGVSPGIPLIFTVLCAWPLQFAAVFAFAESRRSIPARRRAAAAVATVAGVLGLFAGVVTLPLVFPQAWGGFFCEYLWQCVLIEGWFPYVPTVFAAVVLSHAALAVLGGIQSQDAIAGRRLLSAACLLVLVVLVSLIIQFAGAFSGWWWGLASLTAPGYLVAAWGARRESRSWATAVPWPGPGAPSRGLSP